MCSERPRPLANIIVSLIKGCKNKGEFTLLSKIVRDAQISSDEAEIRAIIEAWTQMAKNLGLEENYMGTLNGLQKQLNVVVQNDNQQKNHLSTLIEKAICNPSEVD